jgi:hypothetical protein
MAGVQYTAARTTRFDTELRCPVAVRQLALQVSTSTQSAVLTACVAPLLDVRGVVPLPALVRMLQTLPSTLPADASSELRTTLCELVYRLVLDAYVFEGEDSTCATADVVHFSSLAKSMNHLTKAVSLLATPIASACLLAEVQRTCRAWAAHRPVVPVLLTLQLVFNCPPVMAACTSDHIRDFLSVCDRMLKESILVPASTLTRTQAGTFMIGCGWMTHTLLASGSLKG